MKKLLLVAAVLFAVLFSASSLIGYTKGDFTYKGWPLAYQKTVDTQGLCIGFEGETGDGCGVRRFPTDTAQLVKNAAFWLMLSLTSGYAFCRFRNWL